MECKDPPADGRWENAGRGGSLGLAGLSSYQKPQLKRLGTLQSVAGSDPFLPPLGETPPQSSEQLEVNDTNPPAESAVDKSLE